MRQKKRTKKTDPYFFAQDKAYAKYYDQVDGILNPYLNVTHDLMIDLLVESTRRNRIGQASKSAVLVIGSGTGGEVLRLRKRLPKARIVAVDFSPPMNLQLRKKYGAEFPKRKFETDIDLLESDFLSDDCRPQALCDELQRKFAVRKFDAVIIGFVTHHYSTEQKLEFYRRAKAVLRKGGSLIHGDLFSFDSKWVSHLAHMIGEKWIRQLVNPNAGTIGRANGLGVVARRLCKAWIHHWNHTHIYTPLHSDFDGRAAAPFSSHMAALRKLGFSEVECVLRLWEVGVIFARV